MNRKQLTIDDTYEKEKLAFIPQKNRNHQHDKKQSKERKSILNYEESWEEYVKFMYSNLGKKKSS